MIFLPLEVYTKPVYEHVLSPSGKTGERKKEKSDLSGRISRKHFPEDVHIKGKREENDEKEQKGLISLSHFHKQIRN